MSIPRFLRAPRVRRGLAASIIVLAAGGLVLFRAPAAARLPNLVVTEATASGPNLTTFSGPGAHGHLGLSHSKILAGGERRLYAELQLTADAVDEARERAPLSLVVVIDTSGSMEGDKITQAKDSVVRLLRDMRDDDEIALVRYSSDSELVQSLARVGAVRSSLISKVQGMTASGGTNIAPALASGLRSLDEASSQRVRRVILVSDGLDATRPESEALARTSAARGVTVSSIGVGLDFDESYMGAVARAGHGNFGFVKDAATLATFLRRELTETANTTIERASARVQLPAGVRFVRAVGADARLVNDGREVELSMGSMFSRDERRVVIELAANLDVGTIKGVEGQVSWRRVGGADAEIRLSRLDVAGTDDTRAVEEGRDGAIFGHATSALSSIRQVEATEAYNRGEGAQAQAMIEENLADLRAAATAAPAAVGTALMRQAVDYEQTKGRFAKAAPGSADGKAAAKGSMEKDLSNLGRSAF